MTQNSLIVKVFGSDIFSQDLPEIKKKYKELVRKAHPDVGGSNEAVREVIEAYESVIAFVMARQFPETYTKPSLWDKARKAFYEYIKDADENLSIYDLWLTSKGEVVKIEDMSQWHLKAAIDKVERSTPVNYLAKDKRYQKMKEVFKKFEGNINIQGKRISLNFRG